MVKETASSKLSFWEMFGIGGSASIIAEVATLPLDTIKVRLQVQQDKYSGLIACTRAIYREEGVLAFWQGVSAGIIRQIFYASFRISIFDLAMKKLERKKGGFANVTLLDRIVWGIISGSIAISIANPFDVLKVRFQNAIRSKSSIEKPTLKSEIQYLYNKGGISVFYQSMPPNILRSSMINAAELATYSQIRSYFLKNNFMNEGFSLFLTASAIAGIVAVLTASPFDVIKSRMMTGKIENGQKVMYGSILQAVRELAKKEGFAGFYAGFSANVHRIVWWNVVMFLIKEEITREVIKVKKY